MLIIETLPQLRLQIRRWRQEGKRIALVPTMGNLHDGHMTLVEEAKAAADVVVVSIFVNPMQFDRQEDLARYPRTLQEDCEKLNRRKVDLVFAPAPSDVYPQGMDTQTFVEVPGISTILEGASRPGHFRGVSTIVSKLFNLVQPDVACFGEKDYQQLALIRKMVADMGYDIEIVGVPTVRAKDGLALSSRNGYLSAEQRKIAPGPCQSDELAGRQAARGRARYRRNAGACGSRAERKRLSFRRPANPRRGHAAGAGRAERTRGDPDGRMAWPGASD